MRLETTFIHHFTTTHDSNVLGLVTDGVNVAWYEIQYLGNNARLYAVFLNEEPQAENLSDVSSMTLRNGTLAFVANIQGNQRVYKNEAMFKTGPFRYVSWLKVAQDGTVFYAATNEDGIMKGMMFFREEELLSGPHADSSPLPFQLDQSGERATMVYAAPEEDGQWWIYRDGTPTEGPYHEIQSLWLEDDGRYNFVVKDENDCYHLHFDGKVLVSGREKIYGNKMQQGQLVCRCGPQWFIDGKLIQTLKGTCRVILDGKNIWTVCDNQERSGSGIYCNNELIIEGDYFPSIVVHNGELWTIRKNGRKSAKLTRGTEEVCLVGGNNLKLLMIGDIPVAIGKQLGYSTTVTVGGIPLKNEEILGISDPVQNTENTVTFATNNHAEVSLLTCTLILEEEVTA